MSLITIVPTRYTRNVFFKIILQPIVQLLKISHVDFEVSSSIFREMFDLIINNINI